MSTAYEQLIQVLDERDVRYSTNENESICADFGGEVGTYRIVVRVGLDLFQVFGYAPVRIPEGCRSAMAEAVVRANYGLQVGKFELDFDDGELRFQAAQILTEGTLGDGIIDRLMGTTMAMLDRYLPAFLSVIYGNESPQDAIVCVEAGFRGSEPELDGEQAD